MSSISPHKISVEKWLSDDAYANRRLRHIRENKLPNYEDLKQSLGVPMTELIFQYGMPDNFTPKQLEDFYNANKVECPKVPLWTSPSEQLQGKLKLEVPLISRHQQVFSFNTVMELGGQIENKFTNANDEELERRVAVIREELQKEFEYELEKVRYKLKRELHELYTIRLREVFEKLYKEFKDEMELREKTILMRAEKAKQESINFVRNAMEEELYNATNILEDKYKAQYNFLAEWNSNEVRETYMKKLNLYNNKWTDLVIKAKQTAESKQTAIISNLQNAHRLNLLQVITLERYLSNRMVEETALYFIQRIYQMQGQIRKLYKSLSEANKQLQNKQGEITSWECLLKDMVGQFQKFVNYVLEAVPGDAEYLLSLEKLLERRKQMYHERMEKVGLATENVHPMPSWEQLSKRDSITSESMSDVIHTLMEFILYRGVVNITVKPPHEGFIVGKTKKLAEESTPPSSTKATGGSQEISSFTAETELTTTITATHGTLSGYSSDKSYAFLDMMTPPKQESVITHKEVIGEEETLGEEHDEGEMKILWEEDLILGEEMEEEQEELNGTKDIPVKITMDEELIYGRIDDLENIGKDFQNIIIESPPLSSSDSNKSTSTPSIRFTTSAVPSKIDDSLYISSTSSEYLKCEDGSLRKTKSIVDAEAEQYAKENVDLKFIGTEVPPPPPDKETFVQGRILSVLDIMRAHPQLHNVLIEP